MWLFQFTMAGWGRFHSSRGQWKVEAGQAFCASIPSRHVYHSDPDCPAWEFFWIIVHHPYAVQRLEQHPNLVNSRLSLTEGSACLRAAHRLIEGAKREAGLDPYEVEADLFAWMIEMERQAFSLRHPYDARERLLRFCREYVLTRLHRSLSVSELAAANGMNRSNFSHRFRKVAGQSPAGFVHRIRLEEAAKLLGDQKWSVKQVATQTGFSDANHLCKAFRKRFQTSPAIYRRLNNI